jgi:membrane dipeptidase
VSFFLGTDTPSADDVARHAAYVASLVGVEHVGIGLDNGFSQEGLDDTPAGEFDPSYWWPPSAGYDRAIARATYAPVDTWKRLPMALMGVGMSDPEVSQVLGGNMARVARQVWHHPIG